MEYHSQRKGLLTMSTSDLNPHSAPSFVLVGPLRAGTTLLHLMLDHHPQIASVGEFEEAAAILSDQGFPDPKHYHAWLAGDRVACSRSYTHAPAVESYQDIVSSMWKQLADGHQEPIIGCTIHSRFDRMLELWPNTKFIHIIRDPRDVANSCVGMGWIGHPAKGSDLWIQIAQRWNQLVERLGPDQWVQVRYEDLLEHPERELERCCKLLDLEYHPQMLEFHKTSTYQPLDPKLAEQWRRKMTPRTAEIIDSACNPWMGMYGYQTSTPDPKPASASEYLSIALTNKYQRFRWRVRRDGLSLVLRWALVKRRKLQSQARASVRRRMNEIDTSHLR